MRDKFALYGKNVSTEMEKVALEVQEEFNIQDNVLCALLKINDYFCLIATMRVPIYQLELQDGKGTKPIPEKTQRFFNTHYPNKCSDALNIFNPYSSPNHFKRLAKNILSKSFKLSDYVTNGIPVNKPKEHLGEVEYEYGKSA